MLLSFGNVPIVACRAKAATLVVTHQAAWIVLRKINTPPSLLAIALATGPISWSGRIWYRFAGVTENSDQKKKFFLFSFAKLKDNRVTYSGLRFFGWALDWGLFCARSTGSWYCVMSLLGGLNPVASGGNNRYVCWLVLYVIPLRCIPCGRLSLLDWTPTLGAWLDCCSCPCCSCPCCPCPCW